MNGLSMLGNPQPLPIREPEDKTVPIRYVRAMRGGVGPGAGAKSSAPTKPRAGRLPINTVVML